MSERARKPKQPYEPPRLVVYGDVRALTEQQQGRGRGKGKGRGQGRGKGKSN